MWRFVDDRAARQRLRPYAARHQPVPIHRDLRTCCTALRSPVAGLSDSGGIGLSAKSQHPTAPAQAGTIPNAPRSPRTTPRLNGWQAFLFDHLGPFLRVFDVHIGLDEVLRRTCLGPTAIHATIAHARLDLRARRAPWNKSRCAALSDRSGPRRGLTATKARPAGNGTSRGLFHPSSGHGGIFQADRPSLQGVTDKRPYSDLFCSPSSRTTSPTEMVSEQRSTIGPAGECSVTRRAGGPALVGTCTTVEPCGLSFEKLPFPADLSVWLAAREDRPKVTCPGSGLHIGRSAR